jgi:plasmid maintenance system killer protein
MISGFKNAETEKVFNGLRSRRFEVIANTAYRKLAFLHAAGTLHDLKSPRPALGGSQGRPGWQAQHPDQ